MNQLDFIECLSSVWEVVVQGSHYSDNVNPNLPMALREPPSL